MTKKLIFILIACFSTIIYAEGQINLQQITASGFGNGLLQQTIHPKQTNVATISQLGDQNSASINQNKSGSSFQTNLAQSIQQGNWNNTDITQNGGGNSLLSYQLSYITTGLCKHQENILGVENAFTLNSGASSQVSNGKGNTLTSSQDGTNNQILAIQLGENNLITTDQKGQYNYLSILQQGTNNQLIDYKQANSSGKPLFDSVIQIGENLQLNVPNLSEERQYGNSYSQQGENLSLTINNSLLSSNGGMVVKQTGHDMHIEINQSYFGFPMK